MADKCSGVKLSGSDRGRPCGSVASYVFRGKSYCAAHRTIAAAAPEEFTAARATLGRRLVRAEEEAAAISAKVDAFVESPIFQHPGKSQEFNELDQFYRDLGL
jgi:hypothetical protein